MLFCVHPSMLIALALVLRNGHFLSDGLKVMMRGGNVQPGDTLKTAFAFQKTSVGKSERIEPLQSDRASASAKAYESCSPGTRKTRTSCQSSEECSSVSDFCHPGKKQCLPFCKGSAFFFPSSKSHSTIRGSKRNIFDVTAKGMLPRPDDVWVVSYPKTGSTWVRHLIANLYQAAVDGKYDGASFEEVDRMIPFLEDRTVGPLKLSFTAKSHLASLSPISRSVVICLLAGPRCGRQGAMQCRCPNCAALFRRVIYILRDGQRAMASYWRFRKGLGHLGQKSKFSDFINTYRMYPGVNWADHVRSWIYAEKFVDDLDILWLSYEELQRETHAQVRKIAEFLGINATSKVIAHAVHFSSKEVMSEMEKKAGGLPFFKKRYKSKKNVLKFVSSSSGPSKDTTPSLWKSVPEDSLRKWGNHNNFVMKCLGYAPQSFT